MPEPIHERVWDADYNGAVHVDQDGADLILTADEGVNGDAVTVKLNANGVKRLRLLLARYERNQKA